MPAPKISPKARLPKAPPVINPKMAPKTIPSEALTIFRGLRLNCSLDVFSFCHPFFQISNMSSLPLFYSQRTFYILPAEKEAAIKQKD
jgi:hypothetical protein